MYVGQQQPHQQTKTKNQQAKNKTKSFELRKYDECIAFNNKFPKKKLKS